MVYLAQDNMRGGTGVDNNAMYVAFSLFDGYCNPFVPQSLTELNETIVVEAADFETNKVFNSLMQSKATLRFRIVLLMDQSVSTMDYHENMKVRT